MNYEERVARIMFLREHRRGLLRERCEEGLSYERKQMVDRELRHVKKALRNLDPNGMFPP